MRSELPLEEGLRNSGSMLRKPLLFLPDVEALLGRWRNVADGGADGTVIADCNADESANGATDVSTVRLSIKVLTLDPPADGL